MNTKSSKEESSEEESSDEDEKTKKKEKEKVINVYHVTIPTIVVVPCRCRTIRMNVVVGRGGFTPSSGSQSKFAAIVFFFSSIFY